MRETTFPYFIESIEGFHINFSRPLFTIIFRPKMVFLDTNSILRVKPMYESVKSDVLKSLLKNYLKTVIVGFGQAGVLGFSLKKMQCFLGFIFSNNRRRQLSGSSMISQFGGGSNNNSQAGSTCGSESPLPSPRFTRYIRTPQTSDTNNTGGVNSENSRPCSATSSSTYSPRLGKICSQPPSVHIGEFILI